MKLNHIFAFLVDNARVNGISELSQYCQYIITQCYQYIHCIVCINLSMYVSIYACRTVGGILITNGHTCVINIQLYRTYMCNVCMYVCNVYNTSYLCLFIHLFIHLLMSACGFAGVSCASCRDQSVAWCQFIQQLWKYTNNPYIHTHTERERESLDGVRAWFDSATHHANQFNK